MFNFAKSRRPVLNKPNRRPSFTPALEELENREVMSTITGIAVISPVKVSLPPPNPGMTLISGLPDTPVRTAALTDYQRDGALTRNDMIDILKTGSSNYTSLTSTEYSSLMTLVNNFGTVNMPLYVENLASKTISSANNQLQAEIKSMQYDGVAQKYINSFIATESGPLATYLHGDVNNYFLGQLHPDDSFVSKGQTITPAYTQVNLPLFNGTPKFQDVAQGVDGDCWLMASLAEVADRGPATIQNMFIDNGDGTFTVRLYAGGGGWDYLTVDTFLPAGGSAFDHPQGSLWAALAEKAYVQENSTGLVGSSNPGIDSYQAISGGWPNWAISAITCVSSNSYSSMSNVASAWANGDLVVLCTGNAPSSVAVVPNHCYALVGLSAGQFTLYNPWGVNGGTDGDNGMSYPGFFITSQVGLSGNFTSWNDTATSQAASRAIDSNGALQQNDVDGNPHLRKTLENYSAHGLVYSNRALSFAAMYYAI
jgi:Calpain family cysteine protease